MFSPNFDLILNIADRSASGRLALDGSRVVQATASQARIIRNDPGNTRLRFCQPSTTGERLFDDVDVSAATVRTFLGTPDKLPATGTFPLAPVAAQTSGVLVSGKRYLIVAYVSGDSFTNVGASANVSGNIFTATGTTPATWTHASSVQEITTDLAVDATAAEVQAALNATAAVIALGLVTVTSLTDGNYKVAYTGTFGAQTDISGPVVANMSPYSIVAVSTIQAGTATLHEVQLIRLIAIPYCAAVISTALPSAGDVVATIQLATTRLPMTSRITLSPQPYGGTFLFTLDQIEIEAPFDCTEDQMQSLIGSAYTVIRRASNAWDISGADPAQEIDIASVDVSKLLVPIGVSGRMPLNTEGMADAFAASSTTTLRFTYEIAIQWPGQEPQVVYQCIYECHRDLGNSGSLIPASMIAIMSIDSDFVYAPSITALRGGGLSLENVDTTEIAVDTIYFILIDGYPQGWILKAGAADVDDPTGQVGVVSDHDLHWERAGL